MTSHALSGRGDGRAYFAADKTVYVVDLQQGKAIAFADAPAKIEAITAGADPSAVYVSCGVDVYKLTPDMSDAAP
jgi:hypothetical protein